MKPHMMRSQKTALVSTFLALPTFLLVIFVIYPFVQLFNVSFTDWSGLTKNWNYIGPANFVRLFTDLPNVWVSLSNNLLYFAVHLLFIPLEVLVAYFIVAENRSNRFFRKVILLPYILNGVAVSYVFSAIFAPSAVGGALNMFLSATGLDSLVRNWLGDSKVVNYTLVSVSLWRFSGFHVILFMAGMQSIPKELFEAATIDGAKDLQVFRHIVLPAIVTVTEIVLFLNVRGALQVFDIPFVMTGGGPGYDSSTFTLLTVNTAFRFNNFGLASAMAVVLFFMIVSLTTIQGAIFKGGKKG